MSDSRPSNLSEVLAEEYQVLRSESSYAPTDPKAPEAERLAELFQKVHQQPQPFSALCISGGGIRSATFALGAIQSLADRGLLGQFDYLSTVSGGGYIGSWLTAWIQRAGGYANVVPKLRKEAPKPIPPQLDPIQHLRDFNNYLTPRLGFLSADTWTVAATVIRNMLLNWLVLVPLLLFALTVPRIAVAMITLRHLAGIPPPPHWIWILGATRVAMYVLFALAIYNAVRYLPGVGAVSHTQGDFLRYVLAPLVTAYVLQCVYFDWWSIDTTEGPPTIWHEIGDGLLGCFAGWFAYLLICVAFQNGKRCLKLLFGPISLAMLLLGVGVGVLSWTLFSNIYQSDLISLSHFVALGPPLLLIGFSLAGSIFVGLTSGVLRDDDREWMSRAGAWLTLVIIGWAGICSLVLLIPEYVIALGAWIQSSAVGLGAVCGWISARAGYSGKTPSEGNQQQPKESWQFALATKLAPLIFLTLFFLGLAILTNVILSETGLTKTTWSDYGVLVENTGLGPNLLVAGAFLALGLIMARYININIFSIHAMYRNRLIRAYLGASNAKRKATLFTGFAGNDDLPMYTLNTAYKPFHVVNITLNLVAGERLAWQQRKAQPFTASPLHCGNADLGYRASAGYGDGITLGSAVAISGAAASPNMGYHSSAVVGFIMTLFNARLGAWLGNPGKNGEKTWRHEGPRSAGVSLIKEAFGLTNNTTSYVYLSDGGHFENLGLYEMVRRRCRMIVVLDSGADPSFTYEDLGNAMRKIRIDMNIPIQFDEALIAPLQSRKSRCAVARIGYSAVDGKVADGHLIYVKPICLGNESSDVQSYRCANSTFPHQTTGDQWFDESQTESYRMLGWSTIDEICRKLDGDTLDDMRQAAELYVKSGAESPIPPTAAGARA